MVKGGLQIDAFYQKCLKKIHTTYMHDKKRLILIILLQYQEKILRNMVLANLTLL